MASQPGDNRRATWVLAALAAVQFCVIVWFAFAYSGALQRTDQMTAPQPDEQPADMPPSMSVIECYNGWLGAWNARDLEAYLGYYAEDATRTVASETYGKAVLRQKMEKIFSRGWVRIEGGVPRISHDGTDTVDLSVEQDYEDCNGYHDHGTKEMRWERRGHVWLITREGFATQPGWRGEVVGVTDGDDVSVMHDGRTEKVRLHGIDCPEDGQDFGGRAKALTSELVLGAQVRVVPLDTDQYGRTIGEVFTTDGRNVSEELLASGLAWWYTEYAPAESQLEELQEEARGKGVGLWSHPNPVPPWEWRHRAPRPAEPSVGVFVGSARSNVYHYPTCHHARRIKPSNLVTFSSPEDARRHNYRPCRICCPP